MNEVAPELLAWLNRNGAQVDGLRVRLCDDGERYVEAVRPFRTGETVLSIPYRCLLSADDARRSPLGQQIARAGTFDSDLAFLAATLLAESTQSHSSWKAYIDALPNDYSHLPLFYSVEECQWLAGSLVLEQMIEQREKIVAEQQWLEAHLPGLPWSRYAQARAAVFSRAFTLQVAGRKLDCLVPLADLCNHAVDPPTTWHFDSATGQFLLIAQRHIQPGSEICHNYGRRSNSQLLLRYGFCLDYNPYAEAQVLVTSPPGLSERALALAIPGDSRPLTSRVFRLSTDIDDRDYLELCQFIRATCSPGGSPSERAEQLQQRLVSALQAALDKFPTTIEQDTEILNGDAINRIFRNCLLARLGEKRVLRHWLGFLQANEGIRPVMDNQ